LNASIKHAILIPQKSGNPNESSFHRTARRAGSSEIRRDARSRGEMPDPVAAAGEVVVDIVAASVNGADWKVRDGKSGQLSRFPYILGRDFSGVVSAVGADVTDLRVGDEVFAVCDVGQEGAYAEKIAIKAAIVARKPARLSPVDAGGPIGCHLSMRQRWRLPG
jgi:D-arabinose 1-dehydrogenase-like Zn-dependent alcohol dehydrogenase